MTIITLEDRDAVTDLFDFVDLNGLDDRAHLANRLDRPPITRGFETYLHVSTHPDRTIGDVVDSLRMILRRAFEQGFESYGEDVNGAFYINHLHRGVFHLKVTAPSEVAVFGPFLTFEPHEQLEEVPA